VEALTGYPSSSARPGARVSHVLDNGAPVISIAGELDLSNAGTVETELERIITARPARLVFDLSELSFMDSSGIALLLRARERWAPVIVRDASPAVRRVIVATGLSDVLPEE
jgi:anti-anti-sigma factor